MGMNNKKPSFKKKIDIYKKDKKYDTNKANNQERA